MVYPQPLTNWLWLIKCLKIPAIVLKSRVIAVRQMKRVSLLHPAELCWAVISKANLGCIEVGAHHSISHIGKFSNYCKDYNDMDTGSIGSWRWFENNLQMHLYIFQEQVGHLESSVMKFPFFYHSLAVVNRMIMCGWVLEQEKGQKLLCIHCGFSKFGIFLGLFFFLFDKSTLGYLRLHKIYRKINISIFPSGWFFGWE